MVLLVFNTTKETVITAITANTTPIAAGLLNSGTFGVEEAVDVAEGDEVGLVEADVPEESEDIEAADVDPMISPLPESYTTDPSELGTCATTALLLSDITELPTNISPLAESYAMP